MGMADLGAGGRFPHRLALNVWQGEGAPPQPRGAAGMRHFTVLTRDRAQLEAARARLEVAGAVVEPSGDGFLLGDPSGNRLRLLAAGAARR
jgi:catechol 2,3-dioxygenase